MSRLTGKYDSKEGTTIGMPKAVKCYWKLKDLEDIEDELGIDLIILFKALKYGVYIKEDYLPKSPIRFISPDCLVFDNEYLYELKFCRAYTKLSEHSYPFYFKDYGKTWALTKGELEND